MVLAIKLLSQILNNFILYRHALASTTENCHYVTIISLVPMQVLPAIQYL